MEHPTKPIVFEAASGEHVVVTGADLLTDWRREDDQQQIFSTPWPYRFIGWNARGTHPDDDYHLLIGRCEQVFAEHYPLRQVLARDQLARGTFFADLVAKRLYAWTPDNADLNKGGAASRPQRAESIWETKGANVRLRGPAFPLRRQHGPARGRQHQR